MYFKFRASKALRRTLYHAEHFSVSQFQPRMLIILTRTQLVLWSISNLLEAVLGGQLGPVFVCDTPLSPPLPPPLSPEF